METPQEIALDRRRRIMGKLMGRYKWMLGPDSRCDECTESIDETAIVSIGAALNCAHFSDLEITILCPHCDSLYYLHSRKFFLPNCEISNSYIPTEPLVRRRDLIAQGVHNLLEMTDKEVQDFL